MAKLTSDEFLKKMDRAGSDITYFAHFTLLKGAVVNILDRLAILEALESERVAKTRNSVPKKSRSDIEQAIVHRSIFNPAKNDSGGS